MRRVPTLTWLGIAGVVLTFVGLAGVTAAVLPWHGNADSPLHLDYVWQVSQGRLPDFADAVEYEPLNEIQTYPVQYVSQHPPLFYALLAPPLAPSLERGDWHTAVAIGRVLNIGFGVVGLLALAAAGWTFGGDRKALMAVAVPAVAGASVPFIRVAGDVMNDTLIVVFATVALTLTYRVLRDGPRWQLLAPLALVGALGMASRVTFVAALAISLLGVAASFLVHATGSVARRVAHGALASGALVTTALLPSAWFYLRNYRASGSFQQSGSEDWLAGARPFKSLGSVLSSPQLLVSAVGEPFGPYVPEELSVLAVALLVAVAAFTVVRRRVLPRDPAWRAMVVLLGAYFALILLTQVLHATGYGQFSARYLLPAVLPLALVVAYGALVWSRARGLVVTGLMLGGVAATYVLNTRLLEERYPSLAAPGGWRSLEAAVAANDLSRRILVALAVAALAGVVMATTALVRLTSTGSGDTRFRSTGASPGTPQ